MKFRLVTAMATLLALAAVAPAAQAATISYQGSTLVYGDESGAADDIIVSVDRDYDSQVDMLFIYEYAGNSIGYPTDRCKVAADILRCEIPSGLRAELGGGDDEFVMQSVTPAVPVTLLGGDGNDRLADDYSKAVGSRLEGGAGNDTLTAYKGDDVLLGEGGNDILKGGAGTDEVRGGDGDDELEGDKYEAPSPDVLDGGAGFDIVEEWSIPDGNTHPPASVTQDGVANDGRPGEGDNVTGVEQITSHVNGVYEGTEGADNFWIWSNMAGGNSTIKGFGGNDTLKSLDYSETIDGGAGDDTIQAGYGNDTVIGGPGKDNINSDGGSYCGLYECKVPFGDDAIDARDGEVDTVECGVGNDSVKADATDQVAPSCENVERGGGGGGGGGGDAGNGPTVDPGTVGFALVGRASTRTGLTFRVNCTGACNVTGLLISKGRKLGRGSKTLLAAGKATVRVKLSKKGRKALKRARRTKVTLSIAIKNADGTITPVAKKVTLKR